MNKSENVELLTEREEAKNKFSFARPLSSWDIAIKYATLLFMLIHKYFSNF